MSGKTSPILVGQEMLSEREALFPSDLDERDSIIEIERTTVSDITKSFEEIHFEQNAEDAQQEIESDAYSSKYLRATLEIDAEMAQLEDLEMCKMTYGPDDMKTLVSMMVLAEIYTSSWKYDKAEEMYLQALEGCRRARDPEHLMNVDIMKALGENYRVIGRDPFQRESAFKAEQMYRSVLDFYENRYGLAHAESCNAACIFGLTLRHQGKLNEAEEMLRRVLESCQSLLRTEPISVGIVETSLGSLYCSQGKLDSAEQLFRQALEVKEQLLGPGHLATLSTAAHLALVLANQRKLDDAEKMCRRALEGYSRPQSYTIGAWSEDLSFLEATIALAGIYSDLGREQEAMQLRLKMLRASRRVPSVSHFYTLRMLQVLAFRYGFQDLVPEVLELYKEAKRHRREEFLAWIDTQKEMYQHPKYMAEDLKEERERSKKLKKVLNQKEATYGQGHHNTLKPVLSLAVSYYNVSHEAEAGQLVEEALKIFHASRDEIQDNSVLDFNNMDYSDSEYFENELEMAKQLVTMTKKVQGDAHKDTLGAMHRLAVVHRCLGHKQEAMELQESLVAQHQKVFLEENLETLRGTENLAIIYRSLGRETEAIELLKKVSSAKDGRWVTQPGKRKGPGAPCHFCYELNPDMSHEDVSVRPQSRHPSRVLEGCATCPIVEQAILHLEPTLEEGIGPFLFCMTKTSETVCITLQGMDYSNKEGNTVELFVKNGTPALWKDLDHQQYLRAQASVSGRLGIARGWLKHCRRLHTECERKETSFLPRRVLDLRFFSKTNRLALKEMEGKRGKYACLSYCWGTNNTLRTTDDNLPQMMDDIPWESLPQTYKDAIMVAAALKIPFLWIDALCIIQNQTHHGDWEDQSAKMYEIYGNAELCITAANSRSVQDGFLSQHRPFESPLVFRGSDITVYGRKKFAHTPFVRVEQYRHQNPIRDRAWCFQEHLLSRRMLHFGPEEMFFECAVDSKCECGSFPELEFSNSLLQHYRSVLSSMKSHSLNKQWMDLIQDYAERSLTVRSDRLPAISGIAKILQGQVGAEYLAGHWRTEDLITSLCWTPNDDDRTLPEADWPIRPKEYRAPSWSWASHDNKFYIAAFASYATFHALKENLVLEAHTGPATKDITGAVSQGYLHVRGCMFDAEVRHYEVESPYVKETCNYQLERNGVMVRLLADYKIERELPYSVTCWYIGHGEQEYFSGGGYRRSHILIILDKRDQHPETFERIGWVMLSDPDDITDDPEVGFIEGYECSIREAKIF